MVMSPDQVKKTNQFDIKARADHRTTPRRFGFSS
jgi:hypothetical protein